MTPRRKEGAEPFTVCLQTFASWRLERSGRETPSGLRQGFILSELSDVPRKGLTQRRQDAKRGQSLLRSACRPLRLGALSEAGVRLIRGFVRSLSFPSSPTFLGKAHAKTQRRKEGAEPSAVCLKTFASWRLERSGRETHSGLRQVFIFSELSDVPRKGLTQRRQDAKMGRAFCGLPSDLCVLAS
jgi:hypothetical protein